MRAWLHRVCTVRHVHLSTTVCHSPLASTLSTPAAARPDSSAPTASHVSTVVVVVVVVPWYRTALHFFSLFHFFLVFSFRYFTVLVLVFLPSVSYFSHNRLFLDFYFFFIYFFKTFLFLFSLYARLNWQLDSQFSSANHLSYRIVVVVG